MTEPVLTNKPTSNAVAEVIRAVLVYFVKGIEANEFHAHLNICGLNGRLFFDMKNVFIFLFTNKIVDLVRTRTKTRSKPFKSIMYAIFFDLNSSRVWIVTDLPGIKSISFSCIVSQKRVSFVRVLLYGFQR